FIIRCPKELNPSVNKALFFVRSGGLTVDDHEGNDIRLSPATLKDGWRACAASSPFLLTAPEFKLRAIVDLDDGVLEAGRILQDVPRLRKYFGAVRCIQNILLERLRDSSIRDIPFVDFPDTIKPYVIEPRPFSPAQLEIIKSYKAPSHSRSGPAIP